MKAPKQPKSLRLGTFCVFALVQPGRQLGHKTAVQREAQVKRVGQGEVQRLGSEVVRLGLAIGSIFPDSGGITSRPQEREWERQLAGGLWL